MARYSGGVTTHRALTGPRRTGASLSSPQAWKGEILCTLQSIQAIRTNCDMTEISTVRQAREAGLSWTEIATSLGVTRQSAWERWHELDGEVQGKVRHGPASESQGGKHERTP